MEARGPSRMTQFSQWETTYDHDNDVTEEAKKNTSFKPATIDDHFKPRYHRYHTAYYRTEGNQYHGVAGAGRQHSPESPVRQEFRILLGGSPAGRKAGSGTSAAAPYKAEYPDRGLPCRRTCA